VFAECCVFNKQLQLPDFFDSPALTEQVLHAEERTFSRSYGTILPSSFTQVLSSALVFSTRSPVSVYSTVCFYLKLRRFSWKYGISSFVGHKGQLVMTSQGSEVPDLPKTSPYSLKQGQPTPCPLSLLRLSIAVKAGTGILTGLPSTTRFRLALGADSPCPD
jgi:hypothetical protein